MAPWLSLLAREPAPLTGGAMRDSRLMRERLAHGARGAFRSAEFHWQRCRLARLEKGPFPMGGVFVLGLCAALLAGSIALVIAAVVESAALGWPSPTSFRDLLWAFAMAMAIGVVLGPEPKEETRLRLRARLAVLIERDRLLRAAPRPEAKPARRADRL